MVLNKLVPLVLLPTVNKASTPHTSMLLTSQLKPVLHIYILSISRNKLLVKLPIDTKILETTISITKNGKKITNPILNAVFNSLKINEGILS